MDNERPRLLDEDGSEYKPPRTFIERVAHVIWFICAMIGFAISVAFSRRYGLIPEVNDSVKLIAIWVVAVVTWKVTGMIPLHRSGKDRLRLR